VVSADQNEKIKEVEIYSSDGRSIKKITASESVIRINSADLIKGIFLLQVTTSNGQRSLHKMVRD
jgi:hypothetical protein